ncbi:Carcinoembryonic antigen-related cell adhesion molecule 1 [Cytospora mali]|uniref:Carcinoembryonic antigen-related cell adhesion molecule 1 n=1 Tax=Cytospora mali TaxID=578113 RepID=A0A194VZA0_CYTMA|nr:Carcinoembryonic antigen-related cell adhesion molecule 1 [Valsa mali]
MSNNCISLSGSTTCPAFQSASISTDSTLVGYFLYARFTTTVICNSIVQNSIDPCGLSSSEAEPVCADTCAQFAESEAYYLSDSQLCSDASSGASEQIRADFTNCALPADSLSSGSCIEGSDNEPDNCGFGNSTIGLCSYCASGGTNSTDTCCYNSNAENVCANVTLPSITQTITLPTSTASASPSSSASAGGGGLSGGAIAGIVIGSVVGAALILGLALLCCMFLRRRKRGSQQGSVFNRPAPARRGPPMSQAGPNAATPQGYEVLPGGRIARMSALEGHSREAPSRHSGSVAAVGAGRSRRIDHSSSSDFQDSPVSEPRAGILRPPPTMLKRSGSLSSGSVLLVGDDNGSNGLSSPQGLASQQSEQLPYFKDYYSQDEIHPGDRVAVLWAYQPRAADEFTLERGDMLKVVGIWDDGWATGVMVDERAEEWEIRRQQQRDSGVSNTSGRGRDVSPPVSGEIKAFPLVCVCLPEHWRKTIEGDSSTEAGSSAQQR